MDVTAPSSPASPRPKIVLSIVMPAYNEETTIESVLAEHMTVMGELAPQLSDWEIVVLDDGSADRTPQVLDELARRWPKLRVLKHETNQGLFRAFDDVQRAARGTHVFYTASDGQWPARNLIHMYRVMVESGSDLVVGVRPNRYEVYSAWRRIVSYCFSLLPRVLFGMAIDDPGSVKLGRRELFQFELTSCSPFFEAERIIRAVQLGCRVDYTPIEFLPRSSGEAQGAKLSYVLGSLRDCLRCWWAYRVCRRSAPGTKETVLTGM